MNKYLGLDLESSSSSEGDRNAHPGPIDNSPLFKKNPEEPGEIREHLLEELDYILVPDDTWASLVNEFSITQGQDPIVRKVWILI